MALLGPRAGCPKMCLNSILTILNLNHLRNMWLPMRRMGKGGSGSLGLSDATNKVLLQSRGNYIQYPVINHDGK